MQISKTDIIKAGIVAAARFNTDEGTKVMEIPGHTIRFQDTCEEATLEFVSVDNRFGFYAAYVESRNILLVNFSA